MGRKMRKAIVEGGLVVNIAEVDIASGWKPASGMLVDGDGASIGDTWDGTKFISPVVPEPPTPVVAPKTLFDGAVFLARITDAEYGVILAAASGSIQIARWLDTFRLRGEIDVTGSTALSAKAGLVKAGLLTPDRADVIFATG